MDELERAAGLSKTLGALIANGKIADEVSRAVGSNPIASQLSDDQATSYLASIRNLFPNQSEASVDAALLVWGIRNGVGGLDDYTKKPPIVVGAVSVPAYKIFGEILPLGVEGIPRKFYCTAFEMFVPDFLKNLDLRNSLQPRLAKAGLKPGQELQLIDFVRGTSAATAGLANERNRAKTNLIRQKNVAGRVPGGETVPLAVAEVQHPAGAAFDPHAVGNLY